MSSIAKDAPDEATPGQEAVEKSSEITSEPTPQDKSTPPAPSQEEEVSPPVPARPAAKKLTQVEINIAELTDIFPSMDPKYIKMALIASEGRLEPASNALLFLSDPESGIEIPDPILASKDATNLTGQSIESDEALARRLARSYESKSKQKPLKPARPSKANATRGPTSRTSSNRPYNEFLDVENDSDEDLYEAVTKGVTEVKEAVGGWFGNVAKKIQQTMDQPQTSKSAVRPRNGANNTQRYRDNVDDFEYEDTPPRLPPKDNYYKRQMGNEDGSSSPYQSHPQSSQRGGLLNSEGKEEDAPKLPTRAKKSLYSAMNPSDSSLPRSDELKPKVSQQISLKNNDDEDTEGEAKEDVKKTKGDLAKTSSSVKSEKKVEEKPTKITLTEAEPEPSNDAFLVEDSEDEEDNEKAKA